MASSIFWETEHQAAFRRWPGAYRRRNRASSPTNAKSSSPSGPATAATRNANDDAGAAPLTVPRIAVHDAAERTLARASLDFRAGTAALGALRWLFDAPGERRPSRTFCNNCIPQSPAFKPT